MTEIAASQKQRTRTYTEYKDSGVEWLKEIPTHWDVVSVKYAAEVRYAKMNEKPDDLPYIGLEHIESGTGRLIKKEEIDEVGSTVAHFIKGDVLFGKLRPYLAKVYRAEYEGVGTTELIPLRPRANISGRYLAYELISEGFIDTINALTYGVKMPRVSPDQLGAQKIAIPPLDEQCAIAAYLDRETERIDTLVAKKERLIELLQEKRTALISRAVTKGLDPDVEMRDSGVEWLGAIPAHWAVARLKFMAEVQSGIAKGKKYGDNVETVKLPYLRVANVQDGFLNLDSTSEIEVALDEVDRYSLQPGDVLMNEGGDYDKLGRGTVWSGEIEPCLHQNHVFAVRPHSIESEWLAAITQARYAKHFFILRSVQSTNLASISMTSLQDLPVVLPPDEQRAEILSRISSQTSRIDALIDKVQEGIERLKEYRTALISEAVTGQIDVRDAVRE